MQEDLPYKISGPNFMQGWGDQNKVLLSRDYTGLSKKMDRIWNRYNLKSTGRIYTFGILKCSEKFKVLHLP